MVTIKRVDPKPKKSVIVVGRDAGAAKRAIAEGDRQRVQAARTGNDYNEARVMGRSGGSPLGDKSVKVSRKNPLTGGTKKQIRQAKVSVKKSAASPQAKKSALKLY